MNSYEGTLVALEGIDGSGTSTLTKNLRRGMDRKGYYSLPLDAIYTEEPSDNRYGGFVRDSLESDSEPSVADFFTFLADRVRHTQNTIEPQLSRGAAVISDRYALSTYAYQSKVLDEQLGLVDPFQYIDELTGHFTIPADLYIYLDIDVDLAMERVGDDTDKYEQRERLEEAKRVYDYFAEEKDNVHVIPGDKSEWKIHEEAKTVIERNL